MKREPKMSAVSERTEAYIDSLDKGNGGFLDKLEEYCLENDIPVIRRPMQRLLKTILRIKNPSNILEIGTAVGFSAILMADNAKESHITTVEKYDKRIALAKDNIRDSGFYDRIELIEGDAEDVLRELVSDNKKYDFIFLDAAKGQYINFLPDIIKLLNDKGVLITDNVLQDNTVIESKFAVRRRDRTIHKRMREYLFTITHDDQLHTTILPDADGIAITVYDEKET